MGIRRMLDRNAASLADVKKGDTVIVVAPGPTAEWASAARLFKDQKVGMQGEGVKWKGDGAVRTLIVFHP